MRLLFFRSYGTVRRRFVEIHRRRRSVTYWLWSLVYCSVEVWRPELNYRRGKLGLWWSFRSVMMNLCHRRWGCRRGSGEGFLIRSVSHRVPWRKSKPSFVMLKFVDRCFSILFFLKTVFFVSLMRKFRDFEFNIWFFFNFFCLYFPFLYFDFQPQRRVIRD